MAAVPETEEKTLTLTINGQEVTASPGQTVLEAARSVGVEIPTLCHDPRLEPYGACRLCLVEIEGARAPMPACAAKVNDGMVIHTNTDKVRKLRKFVIELLLSYNPLDCPVCEAAGDCRLQDYAYEYGVSESPWGWHPLDFPTRDDHPNVARNPNRCILCGRCVRICREVMGIGCWGFSNRGYDTIIDTPYNMRLEEVDCVSCGQCISTCPVGALNMKRSRHEARHWQVNKTVTTCGYCAVGCEQLMSTFRGRLVRVSGKIGEGVNNGNLCVKGRFGMDYVNSTERLTVPLVRNEAGELAPASWDAALARAAEGLAAAKKSGGKSIAVLASARCTNEENYLLQKMARTVLGTPHIDSGARLGQAAAVAGLRSTLGYGAMSNSIADIAQSDVIFVIGANVTEDHPVLGLQVIRALRGGARVIVAEPRRTDIAKRATAHLALNPGTDAALLSGMMRHILDSGLENKAFIAEHTDGLEALRESLSGLTVEAAAEACGIPAADIRDAAEVYAGAASASILFAAGVTQQEQGFTNVQALADLALLTGNLGRPGTGVNALSGQANAQGACDMGALPDLLPGYRALDDAEAVKQVESVWGSRIADKNPGKTVTEVLDAIEADEIKAMYVVGENPVLSDAGQERVRAALKKLGFLVVQELFLSETGELADVVLPAASIVEREGTFTNTERRVQRVRRALDPVADSMPDWQIIQMLARRLGASWEYPSPQEVFAEIARAVPQYAGMSYERLEEGGLQWPCESADDEGTAVLYADGFPEGKASFAPVNYVPPSLQTDTAYPIMLLTGCERVHCSTGTRSSRAPGLTGLINRGRLEVNPNDAEPLGLASGSMARVTSEVGTIGAEVWVTPQVPPGVAFLPIHFVDAAANTLLPARADAVVKTPALKAVPVRIEVAG